VGALGVGGVFATQYLSPFSAHFTGASSKAEFASFRTIGEPDVEIALTATQTEVSILPGQPTTVFRYQGELLQGDSESLQLIEGSYLAPIIRLRTGQRIRVNFSNQLSEESIIHWHGLDVPADMDGHPSDVVGPAAHYVYEFDVINQAGTYWFHPHPHGLTATQVHKGLAGLFLVSDDSETAAGLPSGEYDIPLVIQDRTFDANNQFVYAPNRRVGFLGEQILVNGLPNPTLTVENQAYRFRLLNASNSRIYKLAWADGSPLTIIGTDTRLGTPVQRDYVTLGPAERREILVDFSNWLPGTTVTLRSLAFTGAQVGGPPSGGNLSNGAEFDLMTFMTQAGEPTATPTPPSSSQSKTYLPIALNNSPPEELRIADCGFAQRAPDQRKKSEIRNPKSAILRPLPHSPSPRTFSLYIQQGNWTINGRLFEMEQVANEEIVPFGSEETWEFINEPSGGMGGFEMAHPMHIHGPQFKIVQRTPPTDSTLLANWQTVSDGYVDEGKHDTILLMPGERVQIQINFSNYTGRFLYHCHNLEHEDMGMMRNYEVRNL